MPKNNRLTRRKALSASAGLSGAIVGIPSVVVGQSKSNDDFHGQTPTKITEIVDNSEHFVAKPEAYHRVKEQSLSPESLPPSATPNDVEIYFGKYKNAKPPSGKFAELGTPLEVQQNDGPLALESDSESRLVTDSTVVEPQVSDLFYLEKDLGTHTIKEAGHSIDVGIKVGIGLKIDLITSNLQVGATLSCDITFTVGGASLTVTPASFGVSAGPSEKDGYCIGPVKLDWGNLPGGEVELCGALQVLTHSNGEISLKVSLKGLDVCADPCPGINCPVCGSVLSGSVGLTTPRFDPDVFI